MTASLSKSRPLACWRRGEQGPQIGRVASLQGGDRDLHQGGDPLAQLDQLLREQTAGAGPVPGDKAEHDGVEQGDGALVTEPDALQALPDLPRNAGHMVCRDRQPDR
jgi:hypothetical protein